MIIWQPQEWQSCFEFEIIGHSASCDHRFIFLAIIYNQSRVLLIYYFFFLCKVFSHLLCYSFLFNWIPKFWWLGLHRFEVATLINRLMDKQNCLLRSNNHWIQIWDTYRDLSLIFLTSMMVILIQSVTCYSDSLPAAIDTFSYSVICWF